MGGGSRAGYEYSYGFSMVDVNEIKSRFRSYQPCEGANKVVIVEVRTSFIVLIRRSKTEKKEGAVGRIFMGSERHDAHFHHPVAQSTWLSMCLFPRLTEYWMTPAEIDVLCDTATAIAADKAANPRYASLTHLGLVVYLSVCTVQQEGELLGATINRAITADRLTPLSLSEIPTLERCGPMDYELRSFLRQLRRIRVENADQGSSLMPRVCYLCKRKAYVADQISVLPCCCAFHSRCILQELEHTNLCPKCHSPAYDRSIADDDGFGITLARV